MVAPRIPMPLLSLQAVVGPTAAADLPLTAQGTTYTMAQEASFVDEQHYAVGRWDGTLAIFSFVESQTQGPLIAKAVNSPAHEGIQMIVPLGPPTTSFASSNDDQSLLIWTSPTGQWTDLQIEAQVPFESSLGVANSGATVTSNGNPWVVIGHANGYLSIWQQPGWSLQHVVDVRSSSPTNPWSLHNVRGVAALQLGDDQGYVVTGSEDGNLTIVRVSDGSILSATVYNPQAQRGINSIAVSGSSMIVGNCAVGPVDFNLWSYVIDPTTWSVTLADKALLRINPTAPQVFNFDVGFAPLDCGPTWFFCSTEEGVLWMGQLAQSATLNVLGSDQIGSAALGSALCVSGTRVAATAYDLHEYLIS